MANYESRYAELGFYVNGELRKFYSGVYVTDDAAEIAVLELLTDAVRVDQPEEAAEKAPKAPATRKPSAK